MKLSHGLVLTSLAAAACSKPANVPYYQDMDGDGYGTRLVLQTQPLECAAGKVLIPKKHDKDEAPSAVVCKVQTDLKENKFMRLALQGGDCDELDPKVHPGVADIKVDGKDNDCDGTADFPKEPEGLDKPHKWQASNGRVVLGEEVPWQSLVKDFAVAKLPKGVLLAKDSPLLRDRTKQEELWAWLKPSVVERGKHSSSFQKTDTALSLAYAREYAVLLAQSGYKAKEDGYLHTLQGMDCTGMFDAPDADGKMSHQNPSDCSRFFNHYGPDANWQRELEVAKGKAARYTEAQKNDFYVFSGDGVENRLTPGREEQTWIYRRADEVKPEDLVYWTAKIADELAPTVGKVQ